MVTTFPQTFVVPAMTLPLGRRFGLLLGLSAALIGCACVEPVRAGNGSLTFFVTGDTHYGLELWANNEPYNKATIDAMNALPGTAFPASLGGVVDAPRGVLVAGDLTDTPEYPNIYGVHLPPFFHRDGFNDDYAVDGTGRLRYPVYEGLGNHDIHNTTHSYTVDGLRERNLVRPGVTHLSDNGLHYSWDWEGVHFVNLNVYPGYTPDASDSLLFLIEDLQNFVGDSGRPVMLMHHYGFDFFSQGWWSSGERQAYAGVLADYNVAGIFHGHLHTTMQYQWNGYDVFNGSAAHDGNFLVIRLENGRMDVASRENGLWGYTFSKPLLVPEPTSGVLLLAAVVALSFSCHRDFIRKKR